MTTYLSAHLTNSEYGQGTVVIQGEHARMFAGESFAGTTIEVADQDMVYACFSARGLEGRDAVQELEDLVIQDDEGNEYSLDVNQSEFCVLTYAEEIDEIWSGSGIDIRASVQVESFGLECFDQDGSEGIVFVPDLFGVGFEQEGWEIVGTAVPRDCENWGYPDAIGYLVQPVDSVAAHKLADKIRHSNPDLEALAEEHGATLDQHWCAEETTLTLASGWTVVVHPDEVTVEPPGYVPHGRLAYHVSGGYTAYRYRGPDMLPEELSSDLDGFGRLPVDIANSREFTFLEEKIGCPIYGAVKTLTEVFLIV